MDNECAKCGGYAGGANLCLVCEKTAVKRNARKPRLKRLDPLCAELLRVVKGLAEVQRDLQVEDLIRRVEARFKV